MECASRDDVCTSAFACQVLGRAWRQRDRHDRQLEEGPRAGPLPGPGGQDGRRPHRGRGPGSDHPRRGGAPRGHRRPRHGGAA
eukprot:scaffold4997_cov33-Prasinocladus_malaysianus.AAC.1